MSAHILSTSPPLHHHNLLPTKLRPLICLYKKFQFLSKKSQNGSTIWKFYSCDMMDISMHIDFPSEATINHNSFEIYHQCAAQISLFQLTYLIFKYWRM